jgi:hypothetical protein
VGPAIGGLIVAGAGAATAFFTNAVSYLGLVVILIGWQSPARTMSVRERETFVAALIAGARYAVQDTVVRGILWRDVLYGIASAGVLALLPLIAQQRLTGGAMGYGLLLAALGMGSLAGGIAITPLRLRVGPSSAVRVSFLLAAIASGAVIFARSYGLHLCVLLIGMATVMGLSTLNAAIQLSVPRWLAGRVISLHQTALFGGLAAGSILWGSIASRQGLTAAVTGAALVMALLRILSTNFEVHFGADIAKAAA